MKTPILAAILSATALLAGPAAAQAPIRFVNTPEAVRLYEESTLEQLRARCEVSRADGLMGREEVKGLRNGFASVYDRLKESGQYSLFIFDQDKHSFVLVDGQRLTRGSRLLLKLALPRDFARCRIVRHTDGTDYLEVVHRDQTSPTEAQGFTRLLAEASELSRVPVSTSACQPGAPLPFADRTVVNGQSLSFSPCLDSALMLKERMDKTARRVFER